MKPIRKAVRTFLINDNKVIALKYTTENNNGFYDIPGGKIEDNETSVDAAIREFKEETTMDIRNPKYAGNLIVEYPNRVFDFDIYITNDFSGIPSKTNDNTCEWIDIDKLLKKDKIFSVVHLLDKVHNYKLFNSSNFKWHFLSDQNHKKIDEIFYSKDEPFWSEYLDKL